MKVRAGITNAETLVGSTGPALPSLLGGAMVVSGLSGEVTGASKTAAAWRSAVSTGPALGIGILRLGAAEVASWNSSSRQGGCRVSSTLCTTVTSGLELTRRRCASQNEKNISGDASSSSTRNKMAGRNVRSTHPKGGARKKGKRGRSRGRGREESAEGGLGLNASGGV